MINPSEFGKVHHAGHTNLYREHTDNVTASHCCLRKGWGSDNQLLQGWATEPGTPPTL